MEGIVFSGVKPKELKVLVTEYENREPLLSRFVKIPYKCGDKEGIIVGRITDFEFTNTLYEYEQTAKAVAKEDTGIYESFGGVSESLILNVELISAFALDGNGEAERMELSCPVKHGNPVSLITESDIESIFASVKKAKKIGYLGNFLGTDAPAPFYLADFKGLKEALHTLVVGQTGSGKSTLVKMLLTLYAKHNKDMNFLVFDTVGEFASEFQNHSSFFKKHALSQIWKALGRKSPKVLNVENELALNTWDAMKTLMIDNYIFEDLGVPRGSKANTEQGVDYLIERWKKKHFTLGKLFGKLDEVMQDIEGDINALTSFVYKNPDAQERFANSFYFPERKASFKEKLKNIFELFNSNRKSVRGLVRELKGGETVVLDLSTLSDITHSVGNLQKLILRELVWWLSYEGKQTWLSNQTLNTMVVLEEAHNWMPSKTDDPYTQELSDSLAKAYRETRKFGIGWLAITTRPSGLRKEAIQHSRVKFIGMGLSSGSDLELMKEELGNGFLNTYRLFPDPTDPMSKRKKVCFMVNGPITVLSRTTPDFIEVFNTEDEFLEKNGIEVGKVSEVDSECDDFLRMGTDGLEG